MQKRMHRCVGAGMHGIADDAGFLVTPVAARNRFVMFDAPQLQVEAGEKEGSIVEAYMARAWAMKALGHLIQGGWVSNNDARIAQTAQVDEVSSTSGDARSPDGMAGARDCRKLMRGLGGSLYRPAASPESSMDLRWLPLSCLKLMIYRIKVDVDVSFRSPRCRSLRHHRQVVRCCGGWSVPAATMRCAGAPLADVGDNVSGFPSRLQETAGRPSVINLRTRAGESPSWALPMKRNGRSSPRMRGYGAAAGPDPTCERASTDSPGCRYWRRSARLPDSGITSTTSTPRIFPIIPDAEHFTDRDASQVVAGQQQVLGDRLRRVRRGGSC